MSLNPNQLGLKLFNELNNSRKAKQAQQATEKKDQPAAKQAPTKQDSQTIQNYLDQTAALNKAKIKKLPIPYKLLNQDPIKTNNSITLTRKTTDPSDTNGKRDVNLNIFYPDKGTGPFPVVVFSHGGGANNEMYNYIGEHYAANGYVVIMPEHEGSDTTAIIQGYTEGQKTADTNGDGTVDDAENAALIDSLRQKFNNPVEARERALDMSLVLDSVKTIEAKIPGLKGKLDMSKVAAAGHSMGAEATMMLAGATITVDGKTQSAADPRFKAFMPISVVPFGDNIDSYKNINAPIMMVHGEEDKAGTDERWAELKKNGQSYLITSANSSHEDFADVDIMATVTPGDGGYIGAHTQVMNNGLAFLDATLNKSLLAQYYLNNEMGTFVNALGSTLSTK